MTASVFSKNGNVIYRLQSPPAGPVKYQYLVVSDSVEDAQGVDLVAARDFGTAKEKVKAGTGLEIEIAPARKMDGAGVTKWLAQAQEVYRFCKSSGCQFVLSSGATSPRSMVSGRCFDALLKTCGIDPATHWQELAAWLASRLERRVLA